MDMTKEQLTAMGFTETSPNRYGIRAGQATLILTVGNGDTALHVGGSKLVGVKSEEHLRDLIEILECKPLPA